MRRVPALPAASIPVTPRHAPREIVWWFCLPPAHLPEKHQKLLQELLIADAELSQVYEFSQTFSRLFKGDSPEQFSHWLQQTVTSDTPEIKTFARGVLRDKTAVHAGLTLPWS